MVRAGGRALTCDLIVVDELATTDVAAGSELEKLLELPYRESVQAWERMLIERALKAAGGNKAEAARALGVHRRLLYEKLGSEIS